MGKHLLFSNFRATLYVCMFPGPWLMFVTMMPGRQAMHPADGNADFELCGGGLDYDGQTMDRVAMSK